MTSFQQFIDCLYKYLTGKTHENSNVIRKHTKKLETLGDLSFPLKIKSWCLLLSRDTTLLDNNRTIFANISETQNLEDEFLRLITESTQWIYQIEKCKVIRDDLCLFFNRPDTIRKCIQEVIENGEEFGASQKIFKNRIDLEKDISKTEYLNLSELRLEILHRVVTSLISNLTSENMDGTSRKIRMTLKSNEKASNVVICGSILNAKGLKDDSVTSMDLYNKRAIDMQLMAQHKYGVQAKISPIWSDYFKKLGRASVTLEMLQNKPHKNIKISLNYLQTATKGPSFIFYNCARLSTLLKQFDDNPDYPDLPHINEVDLSVLNQPEEWELLYVYVLQFPMMIRSTVISIEDGIINPHYLITYLSNLSSIFSVYYRRVKILTNPRQHMFPVLFARIYLLKCVQIVLHKTLMLLEIEPIKKM